MRAVSNLTAARQAIRIDSRVASKTKAPTSKKGSSYIVTQSDQLVGTLMFEHDVSIDDASEIVDLFDVTDWKDNASMKKLRRKAIKLLGGDTGNRVFGVLRKEGGELSPGAWWTSAAPLRG